MLKTMKDGTRPRKNDTYLPTPKCSETRPRHHKQGAYHWAAVGTFLLLGIITQDRVLKHRQFRSSRPSRGVLAAATLGHGALVRPRLCQRVVRLVGTLQPPRTPAGGQWSGAAVRLRL
jgi:hypothetical protein